MPIKPGSRIRNYGYRKTQSGNKMENRPRSRKEYHTHRWTKASKRFRQQNPLCVRCHNEGRISPAEVTDHIIPPDIYGNFWDPDNWQPLCKKCNIIKGNEDKKLINEHKRAIK